MVRKQYTLLDFDSDLESDSPLSPKPRAKSKAAPKSQPKTSPRTSAIEQPTPAPNTVSNTASPAAPPSTQAAAKTEKSAEKPPETTAKEERPMKLSYTEREVFEEDEGKPQMTRVEIRARRAIYEEIKAKVKKMEANNTSKMIVFRDFRAPWFKAGGNSAIYYAYDIAGRLGKKNINVNPDNDGHSVFDSGVVSFHGIRNLLENFEDKTDFEKPKILNDGWILIFDLKHTYDKSEIKALRELAKERKRKINALVLPKNCHPAIYNDILALIKRMVPKTFKLAPNPRQTFGRSIIDTIIELHSTFLQFTNGKGDPIELLKTMLGEAEALNSLMKILMELRLWDVGVCAPIAQAIAKLTTDLNEELSEREKNAKPRKAELAEESEDNSEDDVEISGAAETNENAENSETIERLADPKDPKNV